MIFNSTMLEVYRNFMHLYHHLSTSMLVGILKRQGVRQVPLFAPILNYRVLKGVSKGSGCSWGTLRIPAGKIGED